jgi:hypothetical protein
MNPMTVDIDRVETLSEGIVERNRGNMLVRAQPRNILARNTTMGPE